MAVGPGPIRTAPIALLSVVVLWLLIGPRIEIASVGGSSVRFEDFLLLGVGLYVIRNWSLIRAEKLVRRGIGLVVLVSLLAAGIGTLTGRVHLGSSLLYSLRPLEYWVVYPAVAVLLHKAGPKAFTWTVGVLIAVTCLNTFAAGLQFVGGIQLGYSNSSISRGAGLTAGPYELGALMAMLACYWLYFRRYGLTVIAFAGLLMSLSRVSLLAGVVGVAVILIGQGFSKEPRIPSSKPKPLLVVGITLAAVALIAVSPRIGNTLVRPALERTQSTSIVGSWQSAGIVVSTTPRQLTSDSYFETTYTGIGDYILGATSSSDASNVVRFFRWQILLREVTASPANLSFGLGPSFAGASVDGTYVRIFVETGLLGLIAWGLMIAGWLKRRPLWLVAVVITMIVGSSFIDLLFALRPMVVLWILIAISQYPSPAVTEARKAAAVKAIGA
jgi:hypothetical protein